MSEELQYLPDPLTDDEHKILDAAVLQTYGPELPFFAPIFAHVLLQDIVQHSHDKLGLDPKWDSKDQARALLRNNPRLTGALKEAWDSGSFRKIRNLEILKRPQETAATIQSPPLRLDALYQSFTSPYRGVAVDGFYEYLRANNTAFRTVKGQDPIYYGQFCSLVQSSGTGKSRLMFELRNKGVAVLYMNIRAATESGFPVRDPVPAYILTENLPSKAIEYGARCYAFFTALFQTLKEDLSHLFALCGDSKSTKVAAKVIEHWNNRMSVLPSVHRDHFFERLEKNFTERLPSFQDAAKAEAAKDVTSAMQNLSLDDRDRLAASQMPGSQTMIEEYMAMIDAFPGIFEGANDDSPKFFIGIDEAHQLSVVHSADGHSYRPSTIICRAISLYSAAKRFTSPAMWVGFASTSSKAGDFAAPRNKSDSARIYYDGHLLYPPYCQLGWDQFAVGLNDIRATDVAKARHIIGYGRALWWSLRGAHVDVDRMIVTAIAKISGQNSDQAWLCMLDQRFGLDIAFGHREAVGYVEQGVASHMRICLSTTEDRRWIYTTYPSEPFLSCAAVAGLHRGDDSFSDALRVLRKKVGSGMVDIGKCGELASRLLWLSAKDLYVRTQHTGNVVRAEQGDGQDDRQRERAWDAELVHCQMIPVVQFFQFVFGGEFWTTADGAEDCFKNAYINFSHWVSMDTKISSSKLIQDQIPSDEWTLRHWHRTAAVQCCHGQPLVDKMIPMYFKEEGHDDYSCMSQIFISDKAGMTDNKETLKNIQRTHASIGCESPKAWIAILVDLGLECKDSDAVSATFPMRSSGRQHAETNPTSSCLRIYAPGLSRNIYPFLKSCPALHETLRFIVDREVIPAPDKIHARYLQQQLHYGQTRTKVHMKWEGWSGTGPIPQ